MMMGNYGDAEVDDMFELRLAEAVDGYREANCFLGTWEVTDDSLDMSDSGGEDSIVSSNKFHDRLMNYDDAIVSGDEVNHKRSRRSKNNKGPAAKTTSKKPAAAAVSKKKNKKKPIVNSVSESSLSDVGTSRVRPRKRKKEPSVVASRQEKKATIEHLGATVFSSANNNPSATQRLRSEEDQDHAKHSSAAATLELQQQQQQQQQQRQSPRSPSSEAATAAASASSSSDSCGVAVQRFPEQAEYRCTLCSEEYMMPTSHNPWWALVRHECPKCLKMQFPSISIGAPANQITFSSLPLPNATTDDDDDVESTEDLSTDDDLVFNFHHSKRNEEDKTEDVHPPSSSPSQQQPAKTTTAAVEEPDSAVDFMIEALADSLPGSLSDPTSSKLFRDDEVEEQRRDSSSSTTNDDGCPCSSSSSCSNGSSCRNASEEDVACETRSTPPPPLSMMSCFEEELSSEDADRLFKLFEHARHCSGKYRSKKHADLCLSAKYVMLHLRDCAGTLPNDNGSDNTHKCPFSWCGPCKRALVKYLV